MSDKVRFEARFYETYYFANVVRNVLSDQFAYLRHLDDFYGDDRIAAYSQPFPKFSAFHSFIQFVIEDLILDTKEINLKARQERTERFGHIPNALDPHPAELPINRALTYYDIPHTSFQQWLQEQGVAFSEADEDDVSEYYEELRLESATERLIEQAVDEVFYVLFGNRRVLLLFNDMMGRVITDLSISEVPDDYKSFFAKDGVLSRTHVPKWAKNAVFFRDRGECVACHCDLSGLINLIADENYDHIVPLAHGGLNDVSNLQLFCKACNLRKRAGAAVTSDVYQAWYKTNGS
jgi:hypothetical protein